MSDSPPSPSLLPGQRAATAVLLLSIAWLAFNASVQSRSIEALANDPAGPAHCAEVSLRIDINSASAAELGLLPGVGPRLAERIIAHRNQFGPFETIEQLDNVLGIGPRTVDRARPHAVAVAERPISNDQSP